MAARFLGLCSLSRHSYDVNTKSRSPNTVLREAKKRQAISHEEIREAERSPKPVSKTYSLPTLHGPGIRSQRDLYTDEAAVSFESDPNASSIEGLQAAHDKIKAAPKKRRPPTRGRSRTSSLGVGDTPVTQDPKAHKRSRTDPKDLTRERTSSGNRLDSSSLSDILNNTIFETSELGEEEEGQAVTSQPETSQRDKEQQDSVIDDVMSRVNNVLAQTSGPSRLSQSGSPSTKLRAAKVDLKNTAETTEKKKLSVSEKRKSLPNRKTVDNEGSDLDRTLKGMLEERELTMAEKRRSFPGKTIVEEGVKKKELTVAEKRRSFTDKFTDEKPKKLESSKTPKESFEKKELTAQEKRKSFTEQKSQESTGKREKSVSSFPKKESVSSFADSIRSSRAETEIVMAENTCQLESEVTFEDFEFDKLLDNEPTTSKQSTDDSKKESEGSPKKQEQQQKDSIKPAVPFKRGKSWSNNYKPKLQEFPFKLDSTEPSPVKKEAQTNVLTEKPELVQQEQVIRKKENKSDTSEKSIPSQFSRTKSWSYGTKPGDVRKANAKENQAPAVENEKDEPAWVASAKQKSRRMSQLLLDDETSENQTPTLVKPNKNSINKPPDSKPQTSPKPTIKAQAKPDSMFEKQPFKAPVRPSKPPVATKEQVKPSTHENPHKPFVIVKDKGPLKASNLYGRSSATLPARTDKNITGQNAMGKNNTRQSLNLSSNETAANKKPFGGIKIDKCIICGTKVYQMEKCKFDDSVLHRDCMKCSVCKRHLTVGNFVMAESKIYCKPHSLIVTVGST
ncbi:ABC transporter F family member 4-like isoform X2 [Actinia tenebrosa]|uniref:ABC transporter F family member 4-like isoform X2 n=1 Tax=Actinia tenebrosa TaxID=6105 RepID=A0A6P8I8R9_ACTTE|nr:ABC transporter F family member 4-like isoform X2 [Actinia tenebrosa]